MNTQTIPGIQINGNTIPPQIAAIPKSKVRTIEELIEGDAYETWTSNELKKAQKRYFEIYAAYPNVSDEESELMGELQESIELCLAHEQEKINVIEQAEADEEFEKYGDPSLTDRERNR